MATLRTRPSRPPNRFWIVKEELEEPGVDPKRTQSYLVYGIFGVLFLVVGTLFVHHLSQDQKQRRPVSVVRGHGPRPRRPRPTATKRPVPTRSTHGVTLATRPPRPHRPAAGSGAHLPADLLVKGTDGSNYARRLKIFRTLAAALDDGSRRALFGEADEKTIESWLTGQEKERRLHALLLRLRLLSG